MSSTQSPAHPIAKTSTDHAHARAGHPIGGVAVGTNAASVTLRNDDSA
jgi:hypothetical protein